MMRAGVAGAILLTMLTPVTILTPAMAQTGYGLRLCNDHLATVFACSCAGPALEREFDERKLEALVKLKALEAAQGKQMVHGLLLRMRKAGLGESLQRLDVLGGECAK
jgi:hypothetical protein